MRRLGHVRDDRDCNDADASFNPDTSWFADTDGDGFGDADANMKQCMQPSGYVLDDSDCDDADAALNPNFTSWFARRR